MAGAINGKQDNQRHELEFSPERVTKNTIRFQEEGDGPKIVGSLYIQNWAISGKRNLKVTIEEI